MPRVAFFKNTTVIDADQNVALAGLLTRVGAAETALATKAAQSAVSALAASKADISYVASAIEPLAAQAAVDRALALKYDAAAAETALALKADQAAVDAALLPLAIESSVATRLGAKADQSAVDVALATKASNTVVEALDARVAMAETGKLNVTVHDARVTAENAFFTAFSDAIHLAASAAPDAPEFSYATLIPAQAGASGALDSGSSSNGTPQTAP